MRTINTIDHVIHPENPGSPSFVGTYQHTIQVNGRERSFITYIPSDVRAASAGILVIPDKGVSAQEMINFSNWVELAETDEYKEKFVVYFLDGTETTWLEDPEDDMAYIHAVYMAARLRDKCIIHESKCYLLGYGSGGSVAQLAAMDYPAIYAGVASVNAPDADAELVAKIGDSPCLDLNGYEDSDWKYGYRKKDFFVPSWIINNEAIDTIAKQNIAKHWRKAGKTAEHGHMLRQDTMEFIRTIPADWTVNQEKEAFRVWVSQIPDADHAYGRKINRRLWSEFLRGVRRWMAEPGGDLRVTKDPVKDLGMDYHYEKIGGWMREYYVFVPESVRKNPNKKVPLVFAMHGYTCSGEIYAGNSEWYKVAKDNEFIAVFPSAAHGYLRFTRHNLQMIMENETELPAWNVFGATEPAPDELLFFAEMLKTISAEYPIDLNRVFATGHSMGSLMVQLLGMARPEMFAAIAPCSGVLFADADTIFVNKAEVINRKDIRVPVWMFGGEHEEWVMDHLPSLDNETGASIHLWWELNKMSGEKPQNFEQYRSDHGRWKDYVFEENGKPLIRYTWVEEMPHATMTEMSYRIWNEFFSKV